MRQKHVFQTVAFIPHYTLRCGNNCYSKLALCVVLSLRFHSLVPASYIGCFNDTGLRAQDKLLVLGCPDVSVCSNTCRGMGFPFASLQFTPNGMENDCICGCSFANSGDVSRPAADCMQMCTNGNNQDPFCGAIDARAVYMTGATVNP